MPDIAMCRGVGCDKRESCYRHRALPSRWQSWADFDTRGDCVSFVGILIGDRLSYPAHEINPVQDIKP